MWIFSSFLPKREGAAIARVAMSDLLENIAVMVAISIGDLKT